VELFEQIRREYTYGAGTIQGVSRKLSVHRRMVRQALANAVPPERKQPVRRKPALDPVMNFIDAILVADELAPRKQRHTARRIWQRIRRERTLASCCRTDCRVDCSNAVEEIIASERTADAPNADTETGGQGY